MDIAGVYIWELGRGMVGTSHNVCRPQNLAEGMWEPFIIGTEGLQITPTKVPLQSLLPVSFLHLSAQGHFKD